MPEDGGDHLKNQRNGAAAEATEADPCMGEDSKKRAAGGRVDRYVAAVGSRTGLDRKGVFVASGVVLLAVALLVVVVALAATWPRIPHKFLFPVCGDAACLRASAQISESLNDSVSPCEDLWTYVCGGWVQKHPLPAEKSLWNPKQRLLQREAEKVRDLVNTLPLPLASSSVEWKLKHLYDACMDIDDINVDGARPLHDFISELGGFYVLGSFSLFEYDKDAVLKNLHYRYGVSPFFQISVEPNPQNPGENSIRIAPGGLGLPDREYYYMDNDHRIHRAYKEFITDVIMNLGAIRSEAKTFSDDIFSYEKRIAEVTPARASLQNPITTYNSLTLLELKQESTIKFYDIVQALFPDANISESTEVIITSPEYLSRISRIISSTDNTMINGYFTWTLIRSYVPYMSSKYTDVLHTFNAELFGIVKPPKRWETCSDLLRNYMGIAVDVLLDKKEPVEQKTDKVVNKTFQSILNIARSRVQKFQGYSSLLQTHLKQKLANLNLQVGIPDYGRNEIYLREYYQKLTIINSNFFVSIRNLKLFNRKVEERKLLNPMKDAIPMEFVVANEATYIPSHHTLVIPRKLLSEESFESRYPKPVIYGRLGVEISKAILSAVLPYESLWTANRKILSLFHMSVNESLKTVAVGTECLRTYILKSNLEMPIMTANETSLNILKHISAISVANEALLTTLDEKQHIHQPGFEEYEDSPLFFLAQAQEHCSESTTQQHLYDRLVNFELEKRSLLYVTWAQLPEFAELFDCTQNKKVQCQGLI